MHGFLLDLDGTLYNGSNPIPYAAQFMNWLDEQHYPYQLVTNNSSRTPEQIAEHLEAFEIRVNPEHIFTSSLAVGMYMRQSTDIRSVYCIGEEGLRQVLEQSGYKLTEEKPDAVVQGIDRSLTYAKLSTAVQCILEGAAYILTNPDHLLPWNGKLTPGAGAISATLQAATQVKPTLIGKPSPIIMNYAVQRLGMEAGKVWVVGDNVQTDIRGGAMASCRTALVLTGLATKDNVDEQTAAAGVWPDVICDDLQQLRLLVEQMSE
jgi:4-nitrophenyl phosphatase